MKEKDMFARCWDRWRFYDHSQMPKPGYLNGNLSDSSICRKDLGCKNCLIGQLMKTELIVFTRRYKWNKYCNHILDDEILQLSRKTKYLQGTFEDNLSWKSLLEKKWK